MAFLFESSKDKELKKTVEDRYYEAVSHENKYEANKNILVGYCNSSNKKAIERMVDLIKANIKDEEISPRQKYFSMLVNPP
jgi:flagellar basal body rod protein FlgG